MNRLCLFLAAAAVVHAGDHSSADYSVAADDLASAGRRASSTDYTADQSVSDSGAPGTSSDYLARQGYTGQLYDPVALALTATPSSVNESSTAQLSAELVNDDATREPLPPNTVTWSAVSGPVQSLSAAGVLTPGAVYADTPARVRGDWNSWTALVDLTILDTDPDNYRNYAADGIPDSWQAGFFGADNPAGEAGADPDADGQINLFEYLAGVVPNDPLSRFDISISDAGPSRKNIEFSPLAPGRIYVLESSPDLLDWDPVPDVRQLNDDVSFRILQDGRAVEPRKFYRITISLE